MKVILNIPSDKDINLKVVRKLIKKLFMQEFNKKITLLPLTKKRERVIEFIRRGQFLKAKKEIQKIQDYGE